MAELFYRYSWIIFDAMAKLAQNGNPIMIYCNITQLLVTFYGLHFMANGHGLPYVLYFTYDNSRVFE